MKWNDDKTITITPPKRPKKITGTRFAAIMGLNKWTTPFNAWCAITRTYEEPFEDTIYTVAGKTIEPKQAEFMKKLEPQIKVFQFEKSDQRYEDLSYEEKQEAQMNIRNGVNFAKKVLVTGECDLLILDEALGLLDAGLLTLEELQVLLKSKSAGMELILTGRTMDPAIRQFADEIYKIKSEK